MPPRMPSGKARRRRRSVGAPGPAGRRRRAAPSDAPPPPRTCTGSPLPSPYRTSRSTSPWPPPRALERESTAHPAARPPTRSSRGPGVAPRLRATPGGGGGGAGGPRGAGGGGGVVGAEASTLPLLDIWRNAHETANGKDGVWERRWLASCSCCRHGAAAGGGMHGASHVNSTQPNRPAWCRSRRAPWHHSRPPLSLGQKYSLHRRKHSQLFVAARPQIAAKIGCRWWDCRAEMSGAEAWQRVVAGTNRPAGQAGRLVGAAHTHVRRRGTGGRAPGGLSRRPLQGGQMDTCRETGQAQVVGGSRQEKAQAAAAAVATRQARVRPLTAHMHVPCSPQTLHGRGGRSERRRGVLHAQALQRPDNAAHPWFAPMRAAVGMTGYHARLRELHRCSARQEQQKQQPLRA